MSWERIIQFIKEMPWGWIIFLAIPFTLLSFLSDRLRFEGGRWHWRKRSWGKSTGDFGETPFQVDLGPDFTSWGNGDYGGNGGNRGNGGNGG